MSFDSNLAKSFEKDGVIELGPILNADEVKTLREQMDRLMYQAPGITGTQVRDLSEVIGQPLTYSVLQMIDMYKLAPEFEQVVRRDDILDLIAEILGPEIRLFRDQGFYKPARHGGEIYLHQDNRYWHLEPPSAVTLWLALDDATIENGCVHFIKGSHQLGRVNHERALAGKSVLLEAQADKGQSVPIEVPAGHATIHHCQTIHWSPPNHTDSPRRAYTVEYMAATVRQKGESCEHYALLRSLGKSKSV